MFGSLGSSCGVHLPQVLLVSLGNLSLRPVIGQWKIFRSASVGLRLSSLLQQQA
jgi:hypothetical protein